MLINNNPNLIRVKKGQQPESKHNYTKKTKSSKELGFKGFYNNPVTRSVVRGTTNMVNESGAIFENVFALFLTGVLRPITIMLTPNAEKRDKQYAAAHSIASGIIGFAMSVAMFKPIAEANKRILKDIEPIANKNGIAENFRNILSETKLEEQERKGLIEAMKKFGQVPDDFSDDVLLRLKKIQLFGKALGRIETEEALKRPVKEGTKGIFERLSSRLKGITSIDKAEKMMSRIIKTLEKSSEKGAKKVPENLKYLTKSKPFELYKRLTTHGLKFLIIPLQAYLTIGLLEPVMKKIFPPKTEDHMLDVNYVASQNLMKDTLFQANSDPQKDIFLDFTLKTRQLRRLNADS